MKPAKLLVALVGLFLFSVTACDDSIVDPGSENESVASLDAEDLADALGKKPMDTPGTAGLQLGYGDASIIYSFPDVVGPSIQIPEGIAFDRRGNMFLSNRIGDDGDWSDNLIEKITPDGRHSILANLGASGTDCGFGGSGLLGLTTDPVGNVFAAFSSCTASSGVMKIYPDGSMEHLAGSEAMLAPNSLTFDSNGNLYVTDSFGGAVYRYGKNGAFEPWVFDALLDPNFESPVPWGANGIAYKAPNHLYVANTANAGMIHIPVLPNGSAGVPEQIVPTGPTPWLFVFPDGVTVDAHGMLYVAIPGAGTPPPPGVPGPFPPFSPVVKMDPSTGYVTAVVEPFDVGGPGSDLFDTVTSLAFGSGPRDRKSVFVVSGDLFQIPGLGSGPVITQVGVGTPGAQGQ